jgi:ABC-type uncharacterized transport system permease subunit
MVLSTLIDFLFRGLDMSAPIAFCALGAVFCEKSGVVNIALEGFLSVTAFTVVWGSILFHSAWMGVVFAVVSGVLMSLLHAVATVTFKVNQIVSGVALNTLAVGVGRFLSQKAFNQETQSAANSYLFPTIRHINAFTFSLVLVTLVSWFVIYKTVFGLRLRTVGENPEAADTLGINVSGLRYVGVIMSGVMCGLAAVVFYPSKWVNGTTGGRGYIALAALIFGRWHPVYAVLAALLFGYADAFRIMFETKIPIPGQFVQMLPYVLAIVVLVAVRRKSRAPAADGIPYEKGE